VKLLDKENGLYEVTIDDDEGGIVDGAHTAKIVWESNDDGTTPIEQHVEVYVRTGIDSSNHLRHCKRTEHWDTGSRSLHL